MKTKRTVFFTMVKHPATGKWTRVGKAYTSRKTATEWLPFVRGAWRNICPVKVSQFTVRFVNGIITAKSKAILDTKYNMDCPDKPTPPTSAEPIHSALSSNTAGSPPACDQSTHTPAPPSNSAAASA